MQLKSKDYAFVSIQLILFVLYVFNFKILDVYINEIISRTGLLIASIGVLIVLIALIQLNTYLSPFPTPKSNTSLIQSGIFKFIRHPIYTGIILTTLGYGLYASSLYKITIALALYILFFLKSKYEEERLNNRFPEYKNYKQNSGRFFPKF